MNAPNAATTSKAPPVYTIVPGVPTTDREAIASLWKVSGLCHHSSEQQKARYDWFYIRNPQGNGDVSYLHTACDEAAVGFLGVGRRRWFLDGVPTLAGVLVDFVVRVDHRTAGPALTLQRRSRERALQWAKVLFGLPDVKAVPIFKRLDKHVQLFLPRHVRVLRYEAYLQQQLPAFLAVGLGTIIGTFDRLLCRARLLGANERGGWVRAFDERFDALWDRVDRRGRSIGLRDARFLNWRFGQQPDLPHRTFVVERADGRMIVYFVCRLFETTLTVVDVLGAGTAAEYTRGLLLLVEAARREGASSISLQMMGDETLERAVRSANFKERDKRPFFAVLHDDVRERSEQAGWFITQADEDT